jgi:exonuclease III
MTSRKFHASPLTFTISELKIQNYYLVQYLCRSIAKMGGVAIFKRYAINFDQIIMGKIGAKISTNFIFECARINIRIQDIIISALYRTPSDNNLEEFFEKLNKYLDLLIIENTSVIIVGDYNINVMKQNNTIRKFKNILRSHGLNTVIDMPTHVTEDTSTCIDNFITDLHTIKPAPIQTHISDHHSIRTLIPIKNDFNSNSKWFKQRK